MYVCVCNAVTDRQIRKAVAEGARTMRDLRRQLDVCSCCGKCGPAARTLLAEGQATDETCEPQWVPAGLAYPA